MIERSAGPAHSNSPSPAIRTEFRVSYGPHVQIFNTWLKEDSFVRAQVGRQKFFRPAPDLQARLGGA